MTRVSTAMAGGQKGPRREARIGMALVEEDGGEGIAIPQMGPMVAEGV